MGWVDFRNAMNFVASAQGLYMKPSFLFSAFSPGLLIPWSDVRFREIKTRFFMRFVLLELGNDQPVELMLLPNLFEKFKPYMSPENQALIQAEISRGGWPGATERWKPVALTIGILVAFIGLAGMPEWTEQYRLWTRGVETQGVVTSKEPRNHRRVHYSYSVDGRAFTGSRSETGANPPFDRLNPGDPIKVFYDPDNPDRSELDRSNPLSYLVAFVPFLMIVAIIVYFTSS